MDEFFYEHPVFRVDELHQWKQDNGYSDDAAATYQAIQYYLRTGRLLRVRRELYAVVPPNETPETVSVDPYLIAGKASDDSVLSYHTALSLYGNTYSFTENYCFLTAKKVKPFDFSGHYFQPTSIPTDLVKSKNEMTEVVTIDRQGVGVNITSIERTFVDVLDRIELSGGWEEIVRSIDTIGALNIDKIVEYSLLLNRKLVNAKVGYFLELRKGAFAPREGQLDKLIKCLPSSPMYASRKKNGAFSLIKKWNLLLPDSVINRTWEDPNHDV